MSDGFGFEALTREAETALVGALDLSPYPLPPHLESVAGRWKDTTVSLQTRAYSGPSIRYARVALLRGNGIEIGNVLALPRTSHSLPILGADLVTLRPDIGMMAVDMSPTAPAGTEREIQLAPIATRRAHHRTLPSGGELPAWCQGLFSPYALFTRGNPLQLFGAREVFNDYVHCFVEMVGNSTPEHEREEQRAESQDAYLRSHRVDDKGLRLLAHIFGDVWAQAYLVQAMFPSVGGGA